MKNLFNVIMDNYKVQVVASSEREAMDLCYRCFNFNKIELSLLNKVKSNSMYPYFPEGCE